MELLDLLFDRRCKLCGSKISKGAVCDTCNKSIVSQMMPRSRYFNVDGRIIKASFLLDYDEEIVKKLLFSLKRNANGELFAYAAELYEKLLYDKHGVSLVFAPRQRQNKRRYGYDHMQRISDCICKRSNGEIKYEKLLKRKHFTKEQKKLNYEKRKRNAEHSFKITKNDIPKNIVLIDDVVTTGNTVVSCAKEIFHHSKECEIEFVFLASRNGFSDKRQFEYQL